MARGLDHIVHAVHDLDAAADFYRRLGFQVGSRNTHPRAWGTQNHIVQLPGTYIELLALAGADVACATEVARPADAAPVVAESTDVVAGATIVAPMTAVMPT